MSERTATPGAAEEGDGAAGGQQDRELNKATTRVLQVLSRFVADKGGFGVTELSHLLGMTKNMTYRALTTLTEQRYLMRDPNDARYHLGYRILELQNSAAPEPDLRTLCHPFLQKLQAITGESVSLVVKAMDYCVLIDGMETRKAGVWRIQIGSLMPLFAPLSGRIILAHMTDDAVKAYIRRATPMRHPRTGALVKPESLWSDIADIRERGYGRVVQDGLQQMITIGFPLYDIDGGLHGVISVGGPRERFERQLDAQLPLLMDLVEELDARTRLYSANATGSEIN